MLIHIHIFPDSKEDRIEQKKELSFNIYVRAKAEANQANRAMIGLIAKHFNILTHKVKIVIGHHNPSKIIEIRDM